MQQCFFYFEKDKFARFLVPIVVPLSTKHILRVLKNGPKLKYREKGRRLVGYGRFHLLCSRIFILPKRRGTQGS
ncbi:hypothetical protein HanXRQr2_Chr04g0177211 [Helianthus annuus]|uniref:Uncharacterized protein n=1 Tax=Helianthus annuus TaxID=4232 RepID=A0A9K3NS40_HELAN|nr:hypothetical protein HanXRQr2_Chr04g0177211 [Helianthus annuus]KAJ0589858.1 hypothetical protein HanIR_Chr04g0190971 [Helianthus annuus]KAJ0932203.1 hypothetical protein HanPSC8_Chr04g0170971 [Helianthus annuus]